MSTMLPILVVLVAAAEVAHADNSTNTTQLGPINHGNNLSCTLTNWYDICIFFLGNYISHAFTIKSYPGEPTSSVLVAAFGALLIPSTGLIRGINSITRNAKFKHKRFWPALFRESDYETAAAAGAFCMVVRKKSWKPYVGDKLSNVVLREESEQVPHKNWRRWRKQQRQCVKGMGVPVWLEVKPLLPRSDSEKDSPEPSRILKVYRGPWTEERGRYWAYTDTADEYVDPSRTVHGLCDFKDQGWSYALAHVPRDAVISINESHHNITPRRLEAASTGLSATSSSSGSVSQPWQAPAVPIVAASYSIPKGAIAIVQLAYALVTLYQSRGNQITHYGYAAFALTVIPYAVMSAVNFFGNMLTPDYQALYLVGSEVMDEAIRRGARFDGVAGRLVVDTEDGPATAEVLEWQKDKEDASAEFSYHDKDTQKTFSVSAFDYSSPPLPGRQRRKYVHQRIEAHNADLSPTIFIPTCSKFLRQNTYTYPTNFSRTQLTIQGTVSLSLVRRSIGWRSIVCYIDAGIVLGIIGAISRFQTGEASVSQLNWTMHWYIFGAAYSGFALGDFLQTQVWPEPDMGPPGRWVSVVASVVTLALYGIPAIGGFVTVIQMLFQWGTCNFY